jgi:hypothetical protein
MVRLFGLGRRPRTVEFRCTCCGNIHRGSPSFSLHRPEHVFDVPEAERNNRVWATDDFCIIHPAQDDGEGQLTYWIRATLDVPIHDVEDPFCWGIWVSQSKESFERYRDTFDQDQSGDSSFGYLPVHMAHYRNEDGSWPMLKCDVNWAAPGQRPKVKLWENECQLYIDQRDGISWDQAVAIATPLMHA